jgi:hypothetical protein
MVGSGVRGIVAVAVLLLVTACGTSDAEPSAASPGESPSAKPSGSASSPAKPVSEDLAVEAPGELTQPLLSSDVLVYSQQSLEKETIEQIKSVKGVTKVEPISMGSFFADEREVTYAAVDPASFRRFTPPGTAQTAAVWKRVAGGEIAIEPKLGRTLQQEDGYLTLGNGDDAEEVHIGAYAQILDPSYARRIDAVVNTRWVDKLGMRRDNAMIVALDDTSPQSIRKQLQKYAGDKASVQILGPDLDINATQTAFLTGGSVAAAVGSFSYTANQDGTVNPDPAWVGANIRSEVMPIIGKVTGHRVMLPQLKAALNEVATRGLADKIYTYDGLYVPRFIARDPSRGLSFHTYGTAIDLNARDNYRGIAGKMDRTVVSIFKKWGFAWGGDWNYTDPMHFELAKLVKVG